MLPVFININKSISAGSSKLTYAELEERFARHGIWYTRIRDSDSYLQYQQVFDNEIVKYEHSRPIVTTPIRCD